MDSLDFSLLNDFQRDFPCTPRPFQALAEALGSTEVEVLARLGRMRDEGAISRVGPVFAPNRVGASTLAAMAVPKPHLERVARLVSSFVEVNHNYEREHRYNLWFVVTARDEDCLEEVLARIEAAAGYSLMSLPLLEEYYIDLGFCLAGGAQRRETAPVAGLRQALSPEARQLVAALRQGLPLASRPYQALGRRCGLVEETVMAQLQTWVEDGTIKRFGVVVRHRELGYTANAMVVHSVPESQIGELGRRLATEPAITLCYRRPSHGTSWPYNLFCMVHGKDREMVSRSVQDLRERQGMAHLPWDILFSRTRFKQTGACYA